MITVSILINGQPIFTRSAAQTGELRSGWHEYTLDTGEKIKHKRPDGAVVLAKMMLDTIKEP